jgi:hypothetical protein
MGRYYEGNIVGKFWTCVQDSACIERYGGTVESQFEWNGCGCCAEEDCEDEYCSGCYDSYEEHLAALDEGDEPEVQETDNYSNMSITKEDFETTAVAWLRENDHLKKHIKIMEFTEVKRTYYDKTYIIDIHSKEAEVQDIDKGDKATWSYVTDYIFLKQIELFFEKNPDAEECNFTGEW